MRGSSIAKSGTRSPDVQCSHPGTPGMRYRHSGDHGHPAEIFNQGGPIGTGAQATSTPCQGASIVKRRRDNPLGFLALLLLAPLVLITADAGAQEPPATPPPAVEPEPDAPQDPSADPQEPGTTEPQEPGTTEPGSEPILEPAIEIQPVVDPEAEEPVEVPEETPEQDPEQETESEEEALVDEIIDEELDQDPEDPVLDEAPADIPEGRGGNRAGLY